MISALESLSFTVHSRPGLYALLIGSGVSRSAGIPTGWEITLDLVKQLANLRGEGDAAINDPEQWYKNKFSKPPNYSALLQEVAPKSAALRSSIIRRYFEPNAEDVAEGSKTYQKAHIAIAELVANGFVRAIITTNFDRLIEKALDSAHVGHTDLSTPSQAMGAMPLAHENCILIKINGDYRDTRIRNTPDELERKYAPPIARLIKQIFDEYGLIVCGWSGEYDTALRSIFESSTNRRFSIFWASKGEPKQLTQKLIRQKQGEIVSIADADSFFRHLADNVLALKKFAMPHPLSTQVAVAKLKRYLSDPKHFIDAHDLLMGGVHDLYANLDHVRSTDRLKDSPYVDRIKFYTSQAETLSCLLAIGCYYGDRSYFDLWARVIEKITNPSHGLFQNANDARGIAALILFYSASIGAVAARNYDLLATLFFSPKIGNTYSEEFVVLRLYPSLMMEAPHGRLPLMKNGKEPATLHDYLFDLMRSRFRDILPHDATYCKAFDRLEYLAVLVRADWRQRDGKGFWAGLGRFARDCRQPGPHNIMDEIEEEMSDAGDDWAPLKVGLFEGRFSRAQEVKRSTDEQIREFMKARRDIYVL